MPYELPDRVLRRTEPTEIEVDGVKLLVRDPTPQEYTDLVKAEMSIVNGKLETSSSYCLRLIELCVVEPKIEDANSLTAAFAGKLTEALDAMMGGKPEEIKNE